MEKVLRTLEYLLSEVKNRASDARAEMEANEKWGPGNENEQFKLRNRAAAAEGRSADISTAIAVIKAAQKVAAEAKQVRYPGEDTVGHYTVDADVMAELHAILSPDPESPKEV